MLKLNAIQLDKIWGYEQWIASTHENGLQQDLLNSMGGNYPLLVKIIQANENLSIQVHPDDDSAKLLEGNDAVGKTECWYVLDALPDASLVYGLKKQYTKEQIKTAILNNTLEDFLNIVPVSKGDFIFIPAGTVHAIGKGLRLLEIQQSCDTTYRLYDWGRGRELHVEKGIAVIKNDKIKPIEKFSKEFSCQYFTLEEINVKGGWGMFVSGEKIPSNWQMLFILEGSGKLKDCKTNQLFDLEKEQIYAIAPSDKITIEGNVRFIRIKCGQDEE